MRTELNKLAREYGLPLICAEGAYALITFVQSGNWLGASWPMYALGRDAYSRFTDEELYLSAELAVGIYPSLWLDSQVNFRRDSENQEMELDEEGFPF